MITFSTFGQSEKLKGVIKADSLIGYAINIVNYTKKIGTTNDDKGYFEILCSVGDSIIFSSVQYKVLALKVTQEHLQHQNLQIKLQSIVQQLDLVRVSNVELSGNLGKDTKSIETKPFVNNKTLGLPFADRQQPTQIERKINTARSGILDLPINYLNGTLKKLKRIKAIEDLNLMVNKGEIALDRSFFIEDLGLPEELITDFVYYCAEDDYFEDLLENSKKLSLLEFFTEKAKAYKMHKEID